ncbi:50S ribosomal protein L28 [Candidatus Comchoanobacter bicostacola]|uniref:Large ribosomal subunit protein bL28 n=1 Tax=Candidatus Comchoanobacter bicostacola TaxID=2919598 RepID=A0ABY5DLI0_9GAMM|nr:50S ribosomal protein L28 [Candidatus Comchoanobacter bicostacola]UTC24627.1 50S ribosomal protein L28 [Candidatus Comchoanobacter bicostacola]
MSICIVTKKVSQVGNNRSHARNATKRTFNVNIQKKTYILPNGKRVRVNISTQGIKTIDKKGVEHLAELLEPNS